MKSLIILSLVALLAACGGGGGNLDTGEETTASSDPHPSQPVPIRSTEGSTTVATETQVAKTCTSDGQLTIVCQ